MAARLSPELRGAGLAVLGTLILTPDTMLMRLSALDATAMTAWRGLLMGLSLLLLWRWQSRHPRQDLRWLTHPAGRRVLVMQAAHVWLFSLGVAVAPAAYVLLGLATVPVVSALVSRRMLGETPSRATWLTIALVGAGITLAVLSGETSQPGGPPGTFSALIGVLAGVAVACSVAVSFVSFRALPALPVPLVMGAGVLSGGLMAALVSGSAAMLAGQLLPIAVTGAVILPLSFLCLSLATRRSSATVVSLILLLETVLGPLWLWRFAAEPLTPGMIAGGALALGSLGVYLMCQTSRNRPILS